jgi:quinol monooxygenase YgiN
MTDLVIQHHVHDFDAWKAVFDEHQSVRQEHGANGHDLYRNEDEPNNVLVIVHFPSHAEAAAFLADPSLRDAMKRAGVDSAPTAVYRTEVEEVRYGAPVG